MGELKISEIDLKRQSDLINGALGLFSNDPIYRDYSVDITAYKTSGTAYYYSRELRAEFINCVQIDTANLKTVGESFVNFDEIAVDDEI